MTKLVLVLILISLTENRWPWFNIFALLLLFPIRLWNKPSYSFNPDQRPNSTLRWVKAAYVFWVLSYLLTQAPISNFFSFDFLRRDGALLFAYLPVLIFGDYGLEETFLRRAISTYLSIMAGLAVFGALQYWATFWNISIFSALVPDELQLVFNSATAGYVFHGLYEAHNAAGAVYGLASCMSLCLLLFGQHQRLWSLPSFWLSANFIGLMLSKSRTSYIAFVAVTLMLLVLKSGYRRAMLKVFVILVVPLAYFVMRQSDVSDRAEAVNDADDPNIVSRWEGFQRAVDDFVSSPLIGIGFGRFNDEYLTFSGTEHIAYVATGGQVVNESSHAHNSYLHFLAEGGLTGFILMMGIWMSAYRWARKVQTYFTQNTFPFAFALCLQACILFEFGISFTEHSMGTGVTSLTIFTMFGVLRNLGRGESANCPATILVPVSLRPSTA